MAMFRALAELAEGLAGEGSRLKKRAAIAEAIACGGGGSRWRMRGCLRCIWRGSRLRRRMGGS